MKKSGPAGNTIVWLLAFAPLIGGILASLVARTADTDINRLWFITGLLNIPLFILDANLLKRNGYNPPKMWTSLLVPVYLFKRATLLGQKKAYFVVWIAAFILSFQADALVGNALPYAEGEYHLDETWTSLRLKPGRGGVRHYIVSGGSVRFKSRPEGPEYRLGPDTKSFTDLEGHALSVLNPDSPDTHGYHTSNATKWVRCEKGNDCVFTIYYTKKSQLAAANASSGAVTPTSSPMPNALASLLSWRPC
jgi:hypothetical protein